MKLLDNKTPQVDFDNIRVFIIAAMSINKAELVKVNGCGAVAANDESANIFYSSWFTYVPVTLQ